ncbi:hypothetical protein BDP55DRAFT_628188 [Colletotrichum godetiae]|uniref:Uncharacterized protein n=1 Tax=Colletotrichum godetiae TaxID=1209918 RepID=A0AAJ0AUD1_9PEZI|nr:uncharacterized protein BDP55DRAFT_628188 [Colletotrichum godetiae]KAK1690532.1 hypothetical protein BDP55DRAFT_628188 [Colletotrichum godetiae]
MAFSYNKDEFVHIIWLCVGYVGIERWLLCRVRASHWKASETIQVQVCCELQGTNRLGPKLNQGGRVGSEAMVTRQLQEPPTMPLTTPYQASKRPISRVGGRTRFIRVMSQERMPMGLTQRQKA